MRNHPSMSISAMVVKGYIDHHCRRYTRRTHHNSTIPVDVDVDHNYNCHLGCYHIDHITAVDRNLDTDHYYSRCNNCHHLVVGVVIVVELGSSHRSRRLRMTVRF
jgi:hypothetical protein